MIDPAFFALLIIFVIGVTRLAPATNYPVRYLGAVLPGPLILGYASPQVLVFAIFTLALFVVLFLFSRNADNKKTKEFLPYAGLLPLLWPDYVHAFVNNQILFLGSAFFIVRQFVTVKESIKKTTDLVTFLKSMVLATFFFASLFTGPIFSGKVANNQLRNREPANESLGAFKLLEGFVFVLPISQFVTWLQTQVSELGGSSEQLIVSSFMHLVAAPVLAFSFVFTTFFGYSRIAEGTAHLLGFKVPENFRQPYMAISFSDFWQRWHRSMADFVMKYLYLPISIHLKNPKLGLMCAFVFMGLWHNVTIGYFIWGLMHGAALIWLQPLVSAPTVSRLLARILTLSYVIYVSYLANYWLVLA